MQSVPGTDLKRKGLSAAVAFIGFLLSPLSWWNDLFINMPLALAFAWLVSWVFPNAFEASFILGYWLTNVLGLVLMQRGAEEVFAKKLKPYGPKQIARDMTIALGYTMLIVTLIKLRWLAPLPDYFPSRR